MLFISSNLNINIFILVLIGFYNRVDFIMAHQCFVCGPKASINCDSFDPTNKSFIKECPFAKACSIQTYGHIVERSCEMIELQDCKTANNVHYCYCLKDLCNGKTISFSDDEDLAEEGSGTTVITNTIQLDTKTSQSNYIEFYLYNIFITFLLVFI